MGLTPLRSSTFGDGWKYAAAQTFEHGAIAEKARNGYMAALIEDPPFPWISLQALAICCESIQPERVDAALHSLTDLMAHPAEPRPVHIELGQGPLQEADAVSVAHDWDNNDIAGPYPGRPVPTPRSEPRHHVASSGAHRKRRARQHRARHPAGGLLGELAWHER